MVITEMSIYLSWARSGEKKSMLFKKLGEERTYPDHSLLPTLID
jgi:hypothetical protein